MGISAIAPLPRLDPIAIAYPARRGGNAPPLPGGPVCTAGRRVASEAETIDYSTTDVGAELRERTGGRGPDVCIEAVGMEAHSPGPQYLYDQAKQQLRLQSERPSAVREAILACRKGGSVFVLQAAGLIIARPGVDEPQA